MKRERGLDSFAVLQVCFLPLTSGVVNRVSLLPVVLGYADVLVFKHRCNLFSIFSTAESNRFCGVLSPAERPVAR